VRLGVAGKIHDPADVQRVLDQGVDIAILGRVGILHHDYPKPFHRGYFDQLLP
jgi:2,4-dienoyl-CoA reductase-like NADH-dependent reductase (Old Yellow Enzyme family)